MYLSFKEDDYTKKGKDIEMRSTIKLFNKPDNDFRKPLGNWNERNLQQKWRNSLNPINE